MLGHPGRAERLGRDVRPIDELGRKVRFDPRNVQPGEPCGPALGKPDMTRRAADVVPSLLVVARDALEDLPAEHERRVERDLEDRRTEPARERPFGAGLDRGLGYPLGGRDLASGELAADATFGTEL